MHRASRVLARAGVFALILTLLTAIACNDDDVDDLAGTPADGDDTPAAGPEPAGENGDSGSADDLDSLYYPDPTPTPDAEETPAPPDEVTPAPADGAVLDSPIAGFELESLTISVGDTIRWTNEDSAPHTATADEGAFDSGNLGQSESFEHTFESAGVFDYFCVVHPTMTGTITVE